MNKEIKSLEMASKRRAEKALRCLPFSSSFYIDAQTKGLKAEIVFNDFKRYSIEPRHWFKDVSGVENAFSWLISIGVLRREVDGQGLTSRIRLTPLGRLIVKENPDLPKQMPDLREKINHWFIRRWPLQ